MVSGVKASLKGVSRKGERYSASILVEYGDKSYTITVDNLAHEPVDVSQEVKEDYLLISLLGKDGKGFATCCIHIGHLERGCMDCPSLMTPPRSGENTGKCSQ